MYAVYDESAMLWPRCCSETAANTCSIFFNVCMMSKVVALTKTEDLVAKPPSRLLILILSVPDTPPEQQCCCLTGASGLSRNC